MQTRGEERYPKKLHGRYRTGNGLVRDVAVTDLSKRGCKFFDRFNRLQPGTYVSIRIGGLGPLDATVRWTKDHFVGLEFNRALHDAMLEHMRTEIEDWQEADEDEPAGLSIKRPDREDGNSKTDMAPSISVRIRPPTANDARDAIEALQMQLPLKTEDEIIAVFHEILNRIFIGVDDH